MPRFESREDLARYLQPLFVGLRHERLILLGLDSNLRLTVRREYRGDEASVIVPAHKLPRDLFRNGCASFVLAHNHPGGTLTPSYADRRVTHRLSSECATLGISFADHLIITDEGAYSMWLEQRLL